MVKTGVIVLAAGFVALAPFLPAQTQTDAGSPVIQVESREVPVDVIVTGKAGRPVKLTAKDFSIREDGKLKKINSVVPATANPETSLKHFVLFFDTSAMTIADQDGACHDLRVSMNVRGLSARARNEYCTKKQPDVVAGKIAGQSLESRAAGGAGGTLSAAIQLPYFYAGANRASVRLAADFVPAGMEFTDDKKGLHGEIDIVGTALRPDGSTAARFADSIDVDRENRQSADQFMKTPYHYAQQFFVTPGTYVFRLEIGAGSNAVGKMEMPLKVESLKPGSLAMGSLVLSRDAQPVDAAVSLAPILEGQGPLIADGKQFVPAATNEFQKSGQAYFYTEFYDPALGGANPPAIDSSVLKMEYCILDQKTGAHKGCSDVVSLENFVHAGNPVVAFGTHIPVDRLPAGSYRLEVQAVIPASQESVTRTVDFEVK